MKSCARCGTLISYGKTYCDCCEPVAKAKIEAKKKANQRRNNKKYNQKRDPKYVRFYSSNLWKSLSAKYAQDRDYKCERCGKIGTQVHHKKNIKTPEGWDNKLNYEELELLCLDCHNHEHRRFTKINKNRGRGL